MEVLNLTGNRLGGKGLSAMCKGLIVNTRLKTLYLADNMIDQVRCERWSTIIFGLIT